MSRETPGGSEIEIRPYRPGDEVAIERGFHQVFGVHRIPGEWAWKFPPSSEEGGRRMMVAMAGGEVIAHMAAQPVRFVVDGRRLLAGHVVDAYSWRRAGLARRGVFARTVDRFFATYGGVDGLAFVIGFPGERHMRLGREVLGYVGPRPVPYREKVLAGFGGEAVQGQATPGGAAAATAFAVTPRRFVRRLVTRLAGLRVEEGLVPAAVDDLWQRAAGRYSVAAARDGRRAAERYTGRPGVDYVHLIAWQRRRAAAWAVARIEGDLLRWADLLWDGASATALIALEEALIARGRAAGARRAELWLGGDPAVEALLGRRGWRAATQPQGLEMTAVAFVPHLDAADIVRRCYVTLGDSDLV